MKKVLLLVLVLAGFYIGCSNRPEVNANEHPIILQRLLDSNFHKKSFDSLLAIICKDTSGIEFSGGLLANASFRVIYEHSAAYLPDVAEFLVKGRFNTMQVSVCIYSMQNLSAVDYVSFCQIILGLYHQGIIKEGMLEQAILPNFLEKRIIPENYQDSDVVALLQNLMQIQNIPLQFKNTLKNVLNGSYIKESKSSPSP
jgi:hypothetical protein